MAFIDEIKAAAAASSSHPKYAERVLMLNEDSCSEDLFRTLTSPGDHYFLDVPVAALVAVCNPHLGAPPAPYTWADAVACLEGTGWNEQTKVYLEGPLKSRALPGSGSAHWELRLTSYAGAVLIDNGKHRAAGAMAWLLRPGASGLLRAALTVVRCDREGGVASVLDLARHGALEVARLTARGERDAMRGLVGGRMWVRAARSGPPRRAGAADREGARA